jgi:coproporphyrinogen III oxidase-like Fe-S oxidoreductase
MSLSPEQRSLRASIGAHALHARYGGREITAAARAARFKKYLEKVDEQTPGLPEDERLRRAEHLLRADMKKLALRSSRARAQRAAADG